MQLTFLGTCAADADREAKRRIELFNQQFKEFLSTHT